VDQIYLLLFVAEGLVVEPEREGGKEKEGGQGQSVREEGSVGASS
jgi:hypothetical protein